MLPIGMLHNLFRFALLVGLGFYSIACDNSAQKFGNGSHKATFETVKLALLKWLGPSESKIPFQLWELDGTRGALIRISEQRPKWRSVDEHFVVIAPPNASKSTLAGWLPIAYTQPQQFLNITHDAAAFEVQMVIDALAYHTGDLRGKPPINTPATDGRLEPLDVKASQRNVQLLSVSAPFVLVYDSASANYGWISQSAMASVSTIADYERVRWQLEALRKLETIPNVVLPSDLEMGLLRLLDSNRIEARFEAFKDDANFLMAQAWRDVAESHPNIEMDEQEAEALVIQRFHELEADYSPIDENIPGDEWLHAKFMVERILMAAGFTADEAFLLAQGIWGDWEVGETLERIVYELDDDPNTDALAFPDLYNRIDTIEALRGSDLLEACVAFIIELYEIKASGHPNG